MTANIYYLGLVNRKILSIRYNPNQNILNNISCL